MGWKINGGPGRSDTPIDRKGLGKGAGGIASLARKEIFVRSPHRAAFAVLLATALLLPAPTPGHAASRQSIHREAHRPCTVISRPGYYFNNCGRCTIEIGALGCPLRACDRAGRMGAGGTAAEGERVSASVNTKTEG